jgi:hypothetical protein
MVSMPDVVEALAQILPLAKKALDRVEPLLTQPFRRQPYVMPLATSQVIAAGATNQPLRASDFTHNLEWDFEVHRVIFSQDVAHTRRDWRFIIQDLIVAQQLMKASAMVDTLVDQNTGAWDLEYPWIVPKKGGGVQPSVDNLDTVNAITVDIALVGFLLMPVPA